MGILRSPFSLTAVNESSSFPLGLSQQVAKSISLVQLFDLLLERASLLSGFYLVR